MREQYLARKNEIENVAALLDQKIAYTHKQAQLLTNQVLPLKKQQEAELQLQYNAMQIGVFHQLQAKVEAIEIEMQRLHSLYQNFKARCQLQQLLSGDLPDAE